MYGSVLYRFAPRLLQESLLSARSWVRGLIKHGPAYHRLLAEAQGRQHWPAERWRAWQLGALSAALLHAREHVPFYAALLEDLQVTKIERDPEAALRRLPLIGKQEVRSAGHAIYADDAGRTLSAHTSGTSGSPLHLIQTFQSVVHEQALVDRQIGMSGFASGQRRAWIRGDLIVPIADQSERFWRLDRAARTLMMSSYHLSAAHAPAYVDALTRHDPVLIQAYPSSIVFLAQWLLDSRQPYAGQALKSIVTSSETLTEAARRLVEQAFGCPVYDWYGQTERVAAIGTCEHGQLHIVEDYSYVELQPNPESGMHEIIGTAFANRAMPLFRYRTGDMVELDELSGPCACGSSFRRVRCVVGRQDDVVKLPDGRRIGRLDHIFKGITAIAEAQVRQDKLDEVHILIVPLPGYGARQRDRLLAQARERLGNDITINVESVPSIARTGNGKLRGVVCTV